MGQLQIKWIWMHYISNLNPEINYFMTFLFTYAHMFHWFYVITSDALSTRSGYILLPSQYPKNLFAKICQKYKKHVTYDMPVLETTSTPIKGAPVYTFDSGFITLFTSTCTRMVAQLVRAFKHVLLAIRCLTPRYRVQTPVGETSPI